MNKKNLKEKFDEFYQRGHINQHDRNEITNWWLSQIQSHYISREWLEEKIMERVNLLDGIDNNVVRVLLELKVALQEDKGELLNNDK